jgi:hypothetical protein
MNDPKTFTITNIGTRTVNLVRIEFYSPIGIEHEADLTNITGGLDGGKSSFTGDVAVVDKLLTVGQSVTFTEDLTNIGVSIAGNRPGLIVVYTVNSVVAIIDTTFVVTPPVEGYVLLTAEDTFYYGYRVAASTVGTLTLSILSNGTWTVAATPSSMTRSKTFDPLAGTWWSRTATGLGTGKYVRFTSSSVVGDAGTTITQGGSTITSATKSAWLSLGTTQTATISVPSSTTKAAVKATFLVELSNSNSADATPTTFGIFSFEIGQGTTVVSGGGCPDPATLITINESGHTRPAMSLAVGDRIWTRHEVTGVFDYYQITSAEIIDQPKVKITFDDNTSILVSDTHKFLMWDLVWKQIFQLAVGDTVKGVDANKTIKSIADIGVGPVVKLEVEDAHTYISAGLISHNKIAVDIEKILTTYSTNAF